MVVQNEHLHNKRVIAPNDPQITYLCLEWIVAQHNKHRMFVECYLCLEWTVHRGWNAQLQNGCDREGGEWCHLLSLVLDV